MCQHERSLIPVLVSVPRRKLLNHPVASCSAKRNPGEMPSIMHYAYETTLHDFWRRKAKYKKNSIDEAYLRVPLGVNISFHQPNPIVKKKRKTPFIMTPKTSVPTIILLFTVLASLFCCHTADAHGHMTEPQIRLAPGDADNGLTFARAPSNNYPCAGVAPGAIVAHWQPGQTVTYKWEIGAPHQGSCFLELATNPDGTDFRVIKTDENCADAAGNGFSSTVHLPDGVTCEHCVLRWRWMAKLTGETYLDCADVSIGSQKRSIDSDLMVNKAQDYRPRGRTAW
ncbi:hypothetical protein BC937DRAFT_93581 [Endogone sp. FLAS-F59071]|nr:hypothetical protein BC937DRAFT_93581 [Endogone sp. FLAS-F59071]|eukprot:RUS14595.1 hypothetical protein BC937DRAFT_93581 [Endogone sp. FLAS-F59071]